MDTLRISPPVFGQLLRLGKPRVVSLIVFTAIIGMLLAVPESPLPERVLFGAIGIALVLNAMFLSYAALYASYSERLARRTVHFSITYLFLLFASLLADHYWRLG